MNHPLRDWLEYTGLSAAARLDSSYPAYSNCSDRFDKLIHP